jgi:hypothetical protein
VIRREFGGGDTAVWDAFGNSAGYRPGFCFGNNDHRAAEAAYDERCRPQK